MATPLRSVRLTAALSLALLALAPLRPFAAGPLTWITATAAEWLTGQTVGTAIDDAGRVTLGPAVTLAADAAAPQVWSVAAAPDGTWVAGTGGDGRVLVSRGGRVSTLLDTAEAQVYAVALAPDGRAFAATSPDGKVYVIEPSGQSRVFFDPAEKSIWALALDAAGRLWVGAGTPAVLYRVEPTGAARAVAHFAAAQVVSLAIDAAGRVIAGTDGPGRIYRVENDRAVALAETGLPEVRALAITPDGAIWAAALAGDSSADQPASSTNVAAAVAPGAAPAASPKSTVLRIGTDGTVATLWDSPDTIYDLAPADAGLLAVAGPEGHVYALRLTDTGVAATLTGGVDARQVTRVARMGARYVLATANPGRVMTLGGDATAGVYLSPVKDARATARWGAIRWDGAGAIQLTTRSGNTATPDDAWSEWSAPLTSAAGAPIASPAARYLQWRATLTPGATAPALTSVTVAYLPANARPVVREIIVHPAGAVFQKPFSDDGAIAGLDDDRNDERRAAQGDGAPVTAALGKRLFQKGLQTFAWKADDPDADRLSYALAYRREGDTTWQTFRTGLLTPLAVWDTTTVPDGRYAVRVTASDAASNTADRALTGARDSATIDIDNTAPDISVVTAGTRLTVTVRDAASSVQSLDYAVAGGAWTPVAPADGVADSREERYEITLPAGADPSRVMLRASDVYQNVAVKRAR